MQHDCEPKLVCTENCVECFSSEFLGPILHCAYNHERKGILLVCFKQLAACTLVR